MSMKNNVLRKKDIMRKKKNLISKTVQKRISLEEKIKNNRDNLITILTKIKSYFNKKIMYKILLVMSQIIRILLLFSSSKILYKIIISKEVVDGNVVFVKQTLIQEIQETNMRIIVKQLRSNV